MATASHLIPVGKAAPPRPLRPDFLISSMTADGAEIESASQCQITTGGPVARSREPGSIVPMRESRLMGWTNVVVIRAPRLRPRQR